MKIHLELTQEEAQVLAEVVGDIRGAGPKRDTCDALYGRLQELLIDREAPVE